MSRNQPFPSNRNGSGTNVPMSAPGTSSTRPLQIGRPPSRPTTPSNSYSSSRMAVPNTAPIGPSRPQRSEMRGRGPEQLDRGSYADSISTARSDGSSATYRSRNGTTNGSFDARPRVQRMGTASTDEQDLTPTSLSSVMSAFQSAGTRRRAMTNGSDDFEYQREREMEMEAEKLRQQRIKDKVPGRRMNGKARVGDIDAVLDQIKDEWEFVIDPEFNSVDLALQLLNDSTSGKDMDSFRQTKYILSKALKGSVDKHYESFAASLPHHSSLLNHMSNIQVQINESRTALLEAKDALGTKRADLVQLWSRGQTLEDMMRLLDQIEHLKSVPDLLETLMSEKRLLQASVLLIQSLKIINKPEMLEIGAVIDLRAYLIGQEVALREILVDELHNHLYLRSFWCESRWSSYIPNQRTFREVEFENDTESKAAPFSQDSPMTSSTPYLRKSTRLGRFLQDLAMRPNDPPYDLSDPNYRANTLASYPNVPQTQNPEADSFAYMENVLESLAALGRLGSSLDIVAQRLPNELFSLVDSTLNDVSERAEYGRRTSMYALNIPMTRSEGVYIYTSSEISGGTTQATAKGDYLHASRLRLAALESFAKAVDHEILRDLFWTLYSKMDAVTQGLRVIYEVANRIGSRHDFKDASGAKPGALFPLEDAWMAVHIELRALIYDYLTNEEQGSTTGRNPISSINETLRDGRHSRDKTKNVFRFTDTDVKSTTKILKQHQDELTRVINDTMPGLVQGASENGNQASLLNFGVDDRLIGAGQHHRLLIKPDAFHVSVLFQPTLSFLERVAEILPPGMEALRTSSTVLDEFVLKVYLPQLEEKVSTLFHQAVSGADTFLPDPLSRKLSPQPLIKASTQLMALINSMCTMLQTTPFHQENYSRLILGVVIQFYQRCSDRFQDLVSIPLSEVAVDSRPTLAAQWAQRSELTTCLSELFSTPDSNLPKQKQLCRQETNLELGFLAGKTVQREDLIPSIRNLSALANLYHSVSWFASELSKLKMDPDGFSMSPKNLEPMSAESVITPYLPVLPITPSELNLPLSKEMTMRFHALLQTYEHLSELILDTIRIDVRCRALSYLDSAMRHGNYSIDREASEPDPHVVDLNMELGEIDDIISTYLPPSARQFVFSGLGFLIEEILISDARHLRLPTPFGIRKINRNILALQQSIRAISNDTQSEFERAKRYFAMFFMTPEEMLVSIREKQHFSFDEYQIMLCLQCGVDQTERGDARHSKATDRNYSMYVIDLHGLELEN